MIDLHFEQTCFACPEQYDVYCGTRKVGYVRLRHGVFSVSTADMVTDLFTRAFPLEDSEATESEELILIMESFNSINPDGIFEDNDQRDAYLKIAARKIKEHLIKD